MRVPQPLRGPSPQHAAAALLSVAVTALMTWPLAGRAGHHVLRAIYYWDAYTNTMIMGSRVDAALGRGPLGPYDSYFFAPLPDTIVFNENHFGLSLIFAPFYLLSDNPLWAYNVTLLVSLSLSVFFTYLLVLRLNGSPWAGLLAGVAFTFSPYMTFEIGRIQLVATQWIPACFLMLHRAIEGRRLRDTLGLCVCYLLQIGTCLYYAMFLIPLLALSAAVLLYRHRPPRRWYLQLLAAGAATGAVALAMVYPYFTSRKAFSLERSEAFASSFDGELGFFKYVHDTNLSLTGMHHRSYADGAHEEIAFPGFTLLAMLLLALAVPLWRGLRQRGARALGMAAAPWLLAVLLGLGATLWSHSVLAGLPLLGLAAVWQGGRALPGPFDGTRGLYLGLLLLAVVMFLGLSPAHFQGRPVHGLYYYFHTYFPGFNGIRKVSRQAVMTTFTFALLSSFGTAWLFARVGRTRWQLLLMCALLASSCYELRVFPHATQRVWAGDAVPPAYRALAAQPEDARVVIAPPDSGAAVFRGHRGMALHNYMALYHKHRTLNGKSTWIPPVTDLVHRALRNLPGESAERILHTLDARYLLLHTEDLEARRRDVPARLDALPGRFERIDQTGHDAPQRLYALRRPADPTLELLTQAPLPAAAKRLSNASLRADASHRSANAGRALDGDQGTRWTGGRFQAPGQYFELKLDKPRRVVAVEFENRRHITHAPLSYSLSVATGGGPLRTVVSQPKLRIYRDLVYAPKSFVFRAVLPEPTVADRVRITLGQPVPGRYFSIHEARLYTAD